MTARMPDGATADLNRHLASQERSESLHEAYGDRVLDSIVEDLMDGQKVSRFTIHDFMEQMDDADFALLMTAKGPESIHKLREVQERIEERLRTFFTEHCPELIADKVEAWDEDARADAAESRRAIREAI